LDIRFKPGSISLDWIHNNYSLKNLKVENCYGLLASACLLLTDDYAYLDGIENVNNYGGITMHMIYSGIPFRNAIVARNISVLNNSYYLDGYGVFGGGFVINTSYLDHPLRATVVNTNISENKIYDFWGGLDNLNAFSVYGSQNIISNTTVAFNESENDLPGTFATWDNMTSCVYNSIFYGNEHPSIVLGAEPPLEEPGILYIDYSLIEQGLDDIWNQQNFNVLHYGVNNIEGNPMFKGDGEHPYELLPESPCINTGTPMYEAGMQPPYIKEEEGKYILYTYDYDTIHLPETDIAGNPRITYGRIDMGAYEFVDTTVNIGQQPPQYLGGEIKVTPNPLQESTAIKFTLLKKGNLKIIIYDMNGRPVKHFLDGYSTPGNFNLRWHADDDHGRKIPSGHYIINVLLDGKNVGSVKVRRW
jgi:hypothetical protein